jgi:hypothetical protein
MMNKVTVMMNRRTDGAQTVLGTIQVRPYRFGDPLEELPTTYSIEAGTPTRAAESIYKIATMTEDNLHDAEGNTWPEGERPLDVADVLVITDDNGKVTIYARGRYSWAQMSENQLPFPEPAD